MNAIICGLYILPTTRSPCLNQVKKLDASTLDGLDVAKSAMHNFIIIL
jgi:hypothetical protein